MTKTLIHFTIICALLMTIFTSDAYTIKLGESIEKPKLQNISNAIDAETKNATLQTFDLLELSSLLLQTYVPDDYEYVPGVGAHKLHTSGASFNNARKRCIMEGAHLAIINSLAEEKKLTDMFRRVPEDKFINVASKKEARLGIHDLFEKYEWVTILGESLYATGYTLWGVSSDGVQQPDNAGGNEDCANLMIDNGGMNDVRCDVSYGFFCEIDVKSLI